MAEAKKETIEYVPGEKLFTRPLVDKITDFLRTTKAVATGGSRTHYYFTVGNSKVNLEQENKSPSGLLRASVDIGHSLQAWVRISGISEITFDVRMGTHFLEFIQESETHCQTISLRDDGIFSSYTNLK